jgi:hypothetical protein
MNIIEASRSVLSIFIFVFKGHKLAIGKKRENISCDLMVGERCQNTDKGSSILQAVLLSASFFSLSALGPDSYICQTHFGAAH